MQEHIHNLAIDELLDLRDLHDLALRRGVQDQDEASDIFHELKLIERELRRRSRNAH